MNIYMQTYVYIYVYIYAVDAIAAHGIVHSRLIHVHTYIKFSYIHNFFVCVIHTLCLYIIRTFMRTCTYVCVHIYTYMRVYIYTYIFTHTHITSMLMSAHVSLCKLRVSSCDRFKNYLHIHICIFICI